MAGPDTRKGFEVALYHSTDGGSTFTFVCGINTTTFTLERGVAETMVRDCDNEFAAPSMARAATTKTASISGSGLYAAEVEQELMTAYDAENGSDYWRVRVKDGGQWQGKFILNSLELGGNADGTAYAEVTTSLQSDGETTYTPSA